ncbi:hypothetical protein [Defluviimonas salinarum]|uniref:Uncharacterized protein n=1 Tax=Defluviimonas salinarum TaxID=2992147 RepID=A0ABT3JAF7_9RHOB|nr:hypothetical protein [Defluviimonas salinarum]MCW3784389.1 hypothetical protein [Defluviimonas salinarum]
MNTFAQACHHLLSGGVICPVATPDLHDWLVEQGGHELLGEHLGRMSLKIAQTAGRRAFFLAWADGTEEGRKAIRDQAKSIQNEAAQVRAFADFMLEVDDTRGVLSIGHLVRAAEISAAVSRSAALRDSLAATAAALGAKGVTDHARISSILGRIQAMGYLKTVSADREEYEVTGRIELFHDIHEHFVSHIGTVERAAEVSTQGSLF